MQQEREKKRQAVVFVSSFHPRGGVFCCSWRDRGVFFFSRRDGAFFFFSEAGRGGCFSFPRRDGAIVFFFRGGTGWFFFFFFDGTGRGDAFFFFEGRAGTVVFGGSNFFGGTGQNRYTVPPKAV